MRDRVGGNGVPRTVRVRCRSVFLLATSATRCDEGRKRPKRPVPAAHSAGQRMVDVHVFFFTRSTNPTEPQDFYRMLRRHLPGACPATFHQHEDVLHPFRDENLPLFAATWWQG